MAVAVVVLHHAGAATLAATATARGHAFWGNLVAGSTASGVELFFVLSGIVLLRPYLRLQRPLRTGVYVGRRIQRLWPPFLAAWLIAGLTVALVTRYPTEWTRSAKLAVFDWGDWLSQIGIVYLGSNSFNPAWWSLTVEILFYALVPLIVVLVSRSNPSRQAMLRLWFVCALAAVAAQATGLDDGAQPLRSLGRFAVYVSCFATGVLLAAHDLPGRWGKWLAGVGFVYVVAACAFPSANAHVGWGLVYFGLVVVALDETSSVARYLRAWPLVWLGERSYSLFLVHMSMLTLASTATSTFVHGKGATYFLISRLVGLPLALFGAMVIFSVVERRFAHGLVSAHAFWPTLRQPELTTAAPQAPAAVVSKRY